MVDDGLYDRVKSVKMDAGEASVMSWNLEIGVWVIRMHTDLNVRP